MDKKSDNPSLKVVLRYVLLQLPGLALFILCLLLLQRWVGITTHLILGLTGFWVIKDVLLFPFIWRSYAQDHYLDRFQMVGRKGIALTCLNPDGYVRVRGERWQARIAKGKAPIEKGEWIRVVAADGLRLEVCIFSGDEPT